MTTEPILTDDDLKDQKINLGVIAPDEFFNRVARAIEQAVLQSPEIQALKDALRELISIVEIHSSVTKNNFAWAELDEAKSAIAALENSNEVGKYYEYRKTN